MQVSPQRTPLELADMRRMLRAAYRSRHGADIGKAEPYLLAMLALENGRGRSIYNHNWGFVTTARGPYFYIGDNPRKFRAFDSHKEGAAHWVATLDSDTHRRIVEAAKRDDFGAFFRGITTPHPETGMMYCDTCSDTRPVYESLVREFQGKAKPSRKTKRKGGGGAIALAALAAGGALLIWKGLSR